jgi:hypothetical protein
MPLPSYQTAWDLSTARGGFPGRAGKYLEKKGILVYNSIVFHSTKSNPLDEQGNIYEKTANASP